MDTNMNGSSVSSIEDWRREHEGSGESLDAVQRASNSIHRRPIAYNHSTNHERDMVGHDSLTFSNRIPDEEDDYTLEPDRKESKVARKQHVGSFRKLEWLSLTFLIVGTVVIFAAIGFISFLWFGNTSNDVWRRIASRSWMTRAVSLTTLALRNAVSAQSVVCTAMLAGLALERGSVLANHLASISTARNSNRGPFWSAWQISLAFISTGRSGRDLFLPLLLWVLVITTLLIQFSSTLLLSDLALGPVLGTRKPSTVSDHFVYNETDLTINRITRGSSWLREPPFYPVFAEWSQPGPEMPAGVIDTGHLLRAFLPLQDQQDRYNIGNYSGIATVLDSRVICVPPDLSDVEALTYGSYGNENRYALLSKISPLTKSPEIYVPTSTTPLLPFGCLFNPTPTPEALWRMSLCQVNHARYQDEGLLSEFIPPTSTEKSTLVGPRYLVLNVTTGTEEQWSRALAQSSEESVDEPGFTPVSTAQRGEWLDLDFRGDGSTIISASLCYAAFDSAEISIAASSSAIRTEPVAVFDSNTTMYRYDNIRRQLGQGTSGSWIQEAFEDRGILQLDARSSWTPQLQLGDYIRPVLSLATEAQFISWLLDDAKFEGPFAVWPGDRDGIIFPPSSNYSAFLTSKTGGVVINAASYAANDDTSALADLTADPSVTSLLQEILQNEGDIAHALSSLITVLAGSTYYDQLAQFSEQSIANQTMFVQVLTPHRHRGYIIVLAVTAAHLILTALTLLLFFRVSRVSSVGNAWQNVAQISDPKTREVLMSGTMLSDSEVKDLFAGGENLHNGRYASLVSGRADDVDPDAEKRSLRADDRVGVRLASSGTRTELFSPS